MQQYCLIGHPLGHSLSPQIHNRLFALEGRTAEYTLNAFPPEELEARLPQLRACAGFNITIPYKRAILPYLQSLDESGRIYGAVNTVAVSQGRMTGYNTDCGGFLRTMQSHQISLHTSVCVLGAGGVGRMFAIECARQGAEVSIAVRPSGREKAQEVAQEIARLGAQARICDIATLSEPFGLLINATPVGMFPKTGVSPVSKELVEQVDTVFDCVYNPRKTQLLLDAEDLGKQAVGGMDMLVWQAAIAHEIWHKSRFAEEEIQKIIDEMNQLLN